MQLASPHTSVHPYYWMVPEVKSSGCFPLNREQAFEQSAFAKFTYTDFNLKSSLKETTTGLHLWDYH